MAADVTTANKLIPLRINHYAIATEDMQVTHRFWTEVMGCEFKGALRGPSHMMSTGDLAPAYLHAFYAFGDGSCIAFFELASGLSRQDDGVPAWAKHLALSVGSREELAEWQRRLQAAGVDVAGEIDHDGLFYSIYFFDPNRQRIELTYQPRDLDENDAREGRAVLESWLSDKTAGTLA
jgi:catechol 2,3-dioxygenase-like lactoylglutathione lyase family enzyme